MNKIIRTAVVGAMLTGALSLGACAGLMVDNKTDSEQVYTGPELPQVDPDHIRVVSPLGRTLSTGDKASPDIVSKYETSNKLIVVAHLTANVGGYGDLYKRAVEKLKNKAGRLGADELVMTSVTSTNDTFYDKAIGDTLLRVTADAVHKQTK